MINNNLTHITHIDNHSVKDVYKKGYSQIVKESVDVPVVIDTNIGVPIVIAITKCDLVEQVADSFCGRRAVVTSRPDHFLNFVLYKLRSIALRCKFLDEILIFRKPIRDLKMVPLFSIHPPLLTSIVSP